MRANLKIGLREQNFLGQPIIFQKLCPKKDVKMFLRLIMQNKQSIL